MKYITVPEPVIVVNATTGRPLADPNDPERDDLPWTLERFVLSFVTADRGWGTGRDDLRAALKFEDALEGSVPGDVVGIEDAWHKRAVRVLEKPSAGAGPMILKQLLPFIDAIADATSKKPEGE